MPSLKRNTQIDDELKTIEPRKSKVITIFGVSVYVDALSTADIVRQYVSRLLREKMLQANIGFYDADVEYSPTFDKAYRIAMLRTDRPIMLKFNGVEIPIFQDDTLEDIGFVKGFFLNVYETQKYLKSNSNLV